MDFTSLDLFGAPLRMHKVWIDYEGPKVFALQSINFGFYYVVNAVEEDEENGNWITFLAAPQSPAAFKTIDSGQKDFRSAFTEAAGGWLDSITWRWSDGTWLSEVRHLSAAELTDDVLPLPGTSLRGSGVLAQEVLPYDESELLDLSWKQNRTTFALKVVPPDPSMKEFPALQSGKLQIAMQKQLDALAAEQGGGYKARFDVEAAVTGQRAASYVITFAISKGISLVERTDLTDRVFTELQELLAQASQGDQGVLVAAFEHHTVRTRLRFKDLLEPLMETGSALRLDTALVTARKVRSVEISASAVASSYKVLANPSRTVRYIELERATLLGADVHTATFDIFDNAAGLRYTGSMTEGARTQADGLPVGEHSYVSAFLRVEYQYDESERAGLSYFLEQIEAWEPGRVRSDHEPDATGTTDVLGGIASDGGMVMDILGEVGASDDDAFRLRGAAPAEDEDAIPPIDDDA